MSHLLVAALLAFLLSGTFIQLAKRYGWGKSIREAGPAAHHAKEGTPTMGGGAFLLATLAALLLLGGYGRADAATLLLIIGTGLLGLIDDIFALRRKRARLAGTEAGTGLLARYRLPLQAALALAFAIYAVNAGHATFGAPAVDALFYVLVIVGSINALNFTDGLDGLAAGVTAVALLFFTSSPVALALMGALLGFLWFNAHPARVFMGGVGAEALGAALAGLAITQDAVWYLPLVALLPVTEVLSVVAQVAYFRATGGKRLLKMSPVHHHFELSGWPETRIVARFILVTGLAVALAYLLRGGA